MLKIAARLDTLRAYCGTQDGLWETLERLKEMGFDGVELESALLKNRERPKVAEKLAALDLPVCAIRSPFARTGFGLEDMIEEAKAFGCAAVGIGTITANYFFSGTAALEKYFEQAQAVCDRFAAENLTPLYDLREHEFTRQSDGTWIFDKLVSRQEAAGYGWEPDALALTRAGVDPRTIFARLSGRMPICHLSDQKIRENDVYFFYAKREECPLGEGVVDLPAWMEAAKAAGAVWITVGQELCDRDPFDCLARSLAWARAFCA